MFNSVVKLDILPRWMYPLSTSRVEEEEDWCGLLSARMNEVDDSGRFFLQAEVQGLIHSRK